MKFKTLRDLFKSSQERPGEKALPKVDPKSPQKKKEVGNYLELCQNDDPSTWRDFDGTP